MNQIKIIFTVCFLFHSIYSFAQAPVFDWAIGIGSNGNESCTETLVDSSGYVYTTGVFVSTMDFDPGPDTFALTPLGSQDLFLLKLTSNGEFVWAKQFGGSGLMQVREMVMDNSGNIYLAGLFSSTIDFDPDIVDTYNLTSNLYPSGYICKLDTSGNFIWVKKYSASNYSYVNSIKIDSNNDLVVGGEFKYSIDLDLGTAVYNVNSNGFVDGFISKIDTAGNFIWGGIVGGSSNDIIANITIDSADNIYACGAFTILADFDPASAVNHLTSNGDGDAFICKFNSAGNYFWAKNIGGVDNEASFLTSVDSDGNIIVICIFNSTIDVDPGPSSLYFSGNGFNNVAIVKLDPNGYLIWARQIYSEQLLFVSSIAIDSQSNLILAGNFSYELDCDPGVSSSILISDPSLTDAYFMKLDANGDYVWGLQVGNDGNDRVNSICLGSNNEIYLAGNYSYATDIDPGPGVYNLPASGGTDINAFILKLNQGSLSVEEKFIDDILIYPNPADDFITLNVPSKINHISIIDISGKTILTKYEGSLENMIDVSFLSNGIYLLEVYIDDSKYYVQKFIINR